MGFFSQKVLGVFLLSKQDVPADELQLFGETFRVQYLKGLKWDGAMRTALEVPVELFDAPEHAMCAVIEKSDLRKELTNRNAAIFVHEANAHSFDVSICALLNGRNKKYPTAQEVFGAYVGRPVAPRVPTAPEARNERAGAGQASTTSAKPVASAGRADAKTTVVPAGSYHDSFEDVGKLAGEMVITIRIAEMSEDEGNLAGAAQQYLMALMQDGTNLGILRRFCRVALSVDELRGQVFWVINNVFATVGVSALTGRDFSLLAQSLFAHVQAGTTAEIDADLAGQGATALGYMLQAISDARYLGYDGPELAQMEAAVQGATRRNAKDSYFFNRTR